MQYRAKWSFEMPTRKHMSLETKELNRVDTNDKEGVRRCEEDFMCDLK
jgi:hypothetical protein